jgi:hypothetical protein
MNRTVRMFDYNLDLALRIFVFPRRGTASTGLAAVGARLDGKKGSGVVLLGGGRLFLRPAAMAKCRLQSQAPRRSTDPAILAVRCAAYHGAA